MEELPFVSVYTLLALSFWLVLTLIVWFLLPSSCSSSSQSISNKKQHAVITGGSSGIGLALAEECLRHGVKHITLMARNKENLEKAKASLEKIAVPEEGKSSIHIVSVDVTNAQKVQETVEELLLTNKKEHGGLLPPPTLLFNNAGTSSSSTFVETSIDEFERLMKINYFGSVYVTHAFLPHMLEHQQDTSSTIVFTSSMAGQLGIYGYSAYSATKAALRGLAESLHMENAPHNVNIIMAYPPDTDTPGYKLEQIGKPEITHLISDNAGLVSPKVVAKKMVSAALQQNPPFAVYFALEGWMLSTLTAGMSPVHTLMDAMCQVCLMGILRFVSLFYLWDFARIIQKSSNNKQEEQRKKKAD